MAKRGRRNHVPAYSAKLRALRRQRGASTGTFFDQAVCACCIQTEVLGSNAANIGLESRTWAAIKLGSAIAFHEDAMVGLRENVHRFAVNTISPLIGGVRDAEIVRSALTYPFLHPTKEKAGA